MILTWGMATTLIMVISTPLVFLASGYPGLKGILVYTAVPPKGLVVSIADSLSFQRGPYKVRGSEACEAPCEACEACEAHKK